MDNFRVKIGGLTYNIDFLDGSPKLNGEDLLGMIDHDRQEIFISSEQHYETKLVTIIHELLHGVVHDRNLPVGGHEEDIVDGLSRGIYQLVVDNPGLVGRFCDKVCETYKEVQ